MKNLNFFKSYLTKLRGLAVLTLMLFAIGVGNVCGTDVTFDATKDSGSGSITKDGVTVSMSTMNRSQKDNFRCNSGTDMTVTSSNTITKIVVTCTANGTANYGPGKFSVPSGGVGSYTYESSGKNGTWTGSATSITLSASTQVRITKIVVTYTPSGCDKKVTLTKGSASNGSFTLDKADGDHDNCDANFVVTVSGITPNSGYACTGVTATGGNNSVSGPDGSGNYTVTYTKGNNITSTITATFALKCATPTFSPEAGTYNNNQSVTITSTAGSTIYYTTDGSTPTTSSAVYSSPISVSSDNTTIKALAVKAGYTNSDVGSATYSLTCATPTFAPVAGTYQTAQSVTLSSTTTSAVIHYTTDGSTPTESSPTASGAITVSADMTIKAIATRTDYGNSAEASASYKIRDCDWYESFDGTTGSGGNDDTWSGSIGTSTVVGDDSHSWTVTGGGGAYQCIKIGTGKAGGSAQTPVLTGLTGNLILTFRAAGWSGESPSISIASTSGTVSPASVDVIAQTWDYYEIAITNVTTDPQITISCSSGNERFFLDEVCIKNSGVQYSVTYDDNDATNGSVPTDGNKYDRNGSATVLGNTGNLAKTGWTFAGWNTAADGSGTTYAAGSTYSNITSNVTLYAKWTCTVTWSVNENTSAYTPETVTYNPSGSKVTIVPRPDPEDYCGDKFVGWYTADYDDDDTAPTGTFKNVDDSPNITGDRTFYAVFADFVAE